MLHTQHRYHDRYLHLATEAYETCVRFSTAVFFSTGCYRSTSSTRYAACLFEVTPQSTAAVRVKLQHVTHTHARARARAHTYTHTWPKFKNCPPACVRVCVLPSHLFWVSVYTIRYMWAHRPGGTQTGRKVNTFFSLFFSSSPYFRGVKYCTSKCKYLSQEGFGRPSPFCIFESKSV